MEGAAAEGKRKKAALRAEGGVGGLPLRHGAIAAAAAVGVALVAVAAARNRKKKKAQRPSKDEDGGTDAPGGAREETAMGEERERRSLPLVSQGSPPSRPPLPPPAENHLPRFRHRRVNDDPVSEYETDVVVRVAISEGAAAEESKIPLTKHSMGGKDEEGSPEEEGEGFLEGTPSSSAAPPLPSSLEDHLHPHDQARTAPPPSRDELSFSAAQGEGIPSSKDEHPPDYPTPEKIIEEERGRQVGEEEEPTDLPKTIEVVEEALEEIPSAEEEEETEISPEEAVKASWPPAEIAAVQEETSTKKSGGSGLVAILVSWKNSRNLLFWLSLFFVAVAATLLYEFNLHLPQSSPL